MKKYIVILIMVIILEGIIGYSLVNNKDVFWVSHTGDGQNSYRSLFSLDTLTFKGLSFITSDCKNNLYAIDDSQDRITKLNSKQEVMYVIKGNSSCENFKSIVVDDKGNIYAMNVVSGSNGYYIVGEQIVKYDSNGKFDKVVYSQKYSEKDLIRSGFLTMSKVKDNNLFFYDIRNNEITLKSIDLYGDNLKTVENVSFYKNPYVSNITGLEKGKIFYTTKTGEIYKINKDGISEKLYPNDNNEGLSKAIPEFIDCDNDYVYFIDMNYKQIKKFPVEDSSYIQNIFSMDDIVSDEIKLPYADYLSVGNNSNLFMATNDHIVCIKNNKIAFSISTGRYSNNLYTFRLIVWFLPFACIALFIFALWLVYYKIMERRVSLLLKQIFAFIPIMIAVILVFTFIYKSLANQYNEKSKEDLKLLAHIGSNKIDAKIIEKINKPSDFRGDAYMQLRDQAHSMYEGKPDMEDEPFYGDAYKVEDGEIYACVSYEDDVTPYAHAYSSNYNYLNAVKAVAKDGKIRVGVSFDSMGQWAYAVAPIYNSYGKIVGLFETGSSMDEFTRYEKYSLEMIFKISIPIIILMVVAFFMITYNSLRPIREVRKAAGEIASGKFDTEVSVKSMDEVAELGEGFNVMSKYIRDYILQITELSESCYRFVPQQYLSMLGKESILDVNLGDQVKCEMSVLTLNIRHFFAFSETMTPEENFTFINTFLKDISPLVGKNNGFIDKFTGSGIISLFPDNAKTSIETALDVMEELRRFNKNIKDKGIEEISIGVGIHKGPLMLGIIGDRRRLEGTVISDTVNLAITLEKISLKLGASVLVTESIIKDIEQNGNYQYRFLGLVRLEGKEEPVRIYDFYEGDKENIKIMKDKTKKLFEEGIKFYQDKCFYDARNRFLEVIKRNGKDEAAKIYFFLCDKYYKESEIVDWKGILIL